MKYKNFLEEMKEKIKEYLGKDIRVEEKSVLKNNGIRKNGIVIMEGKQNCTPTIYLDEYFEQFKEGRCVYDIAYEIVKYYEEHKVEVHIKLDEFSEFDNIKEKLCFRLINAEKNKELLKEIPYIAFLDLAIVFYSVFDHETIGSGSILIKNEHLRKWNVEIEDLKRYAFLNAPKLFEGEILPMEDVIYTMIKDKLIAEIEDGIKKQTDSYIQVTDKMVEPIVQEMMEKIYSEPKGPKMYVASNDKRSFGAAVILYNGILEKFSKKNNADYYILPSSVHEVILIPTDDVEDISKLKEMVYDVNRKELCPEDILSDSVYLYTQNDGRIRKIG